MPATTPPPVKLTDDQADTVIAGLKPVHQLSLESDDDHDELQQALLRSGGKATVYRHQRPHCLVVYPAAGDTPLRLFLCDSGYWAHNLETSAADEFVRIEERVGVTSNGNRIYLSYDERLIFYVEPSDTAGRSHLAIFSVVQPLDLTPLLQPSRRQVSPPPSTPTWVGGVGQ